MSPSVGLVMGANCFLTEHSFGGIDGMKEAVSILNAEGVKNIDSAAIHGEHEHIMAKIEIAKTFEIDSKWSGAAMPVPSTKEAIIASAEASLKNMGVDQFDVYCLHAPDRRVALEIQLDAINTLHQQGKIKRFGISNAFGYEVEEMVRIAKDNNWVLPSVYQGNYSAVARRPEKELFPILRQYGIAFYAYSPIAGGFLAKDSEQFGNEPQGTGRWDPSNVVGGLYHFLYNRPAMVEGLRQWNVLSNESRIPKAELAYRWVVHNSALLGENGDKIIIGPQDLRQLNEILEFVKKGPLSDEVGKKIDELWKVVEDDAPLDNWNDGLSKMNFALNDYDAKGLYGKE
ncbi:NADP-dependent oxidoreductase domain-containing protein [Aspergillus granulosus]|uniref:NADP-dependent oxidoreductase domain-containing protein n=1 Tax=Aspergillus granulosus TaxID=176169 RepID=A0ABR4HM30_9EURO